MSQPSLISGLQMWIWAPQLQPSNAATPHGDSWEARGMQEARWARKQDWPQIAEVHMKRMNSVSSETTIFPYISSVTQSCLSLCDSVDCSNPGFPVLLHLSELSWTYVWVWVGDTIHHLILCCPLLLSFPASGSFPMSLRFASDGQGIGASASATVLPMNI